MTFKYFSLIIVILLISSCGKECIEGDGQLAAEIRDVEEFDKLVNTSTFNVFINKGQVYEASIQGDSNIVAQTQLNVGGNELEIDPKNICGSTLNLRADLVVPNLTKITNEGTGNIRGTTDYFDLEINNQGTGDIELTGQSLEQLDINNEGTGSILMFGLGSKTATVKNAGIGDVFVFVSENLDVTIEGTGNVYYKGSPNIVSNITGIGQLIDDN